MKVPIAWLRDYLDVSLDSDDIAARLAALGFPVEEIERRPALSGIVIGKITALEKHPAADRLHVCTLDVGAGRPLTIATAATNVAAGQVVPVATIGAQLTNMHIGPRKMRGIDSEGMLCSADEVGLTAEWFEDGIMQLEAGLEPGADFAQLFGLNDDVLDVEIVANRVDALSIVGLARELAASLGERVREPSIEIVRYQTIVPSDARVTIESPDCKRFVAQRFSNVEVRPAPFWMRVRLALAGQRPINNLVDISNFVMLETAQPLHFYDFEHLAGSRLIARDAREGETIRTLDEADRTLNPRFLVIADEREPQSIAGLKGGAGSEITPATRELLVEAATFSGTRIRRMSAALGSRTEASTRHEKGLPPAHSTWGAARAAHLLEREGATVHPPFAAGAEVVPAEAIRVDVDRFEALLGTYVTEVEAERALHALGFAARALTIEDQLGEAPKRVVEAVPPAWRGDVAIPEDVVEEVARIIGYDRIVAEMPPVLEQDVSSRAYRDESRVAHALAALGYREAVSTSLQPAAVAETYARAGVTLPGPVVGIANPLSEDQRFLRFSLLPGLLALAAKAQRDEPFRAFEIGHVFCGEQYVETPGIAWLSTLPRAVEPVWRDGGFLSFKGESLGLLRTLAGRDAEAGAATAAAWHPGKTAQLRINGSDVATIGAVDPRLLAAYGVEARAYAGWMRFSDIPDYAVPRYAAPSKYPPIARDLALVVAPEVPAGAIEGAVIAGGRGLVANVRMFDEYRGSQIPDGKKSLAVRIVLQRDDATLTDGDADTAVAAILAALRDRCGALLRT